VDINSIEITNLPKRKIKAILNDPEKTAAAANLRYVNDTQPGIQRIKKGEVFKYVIGDRKVEDKNNLQRIKSLVIPPAWENVWICTLSNGHLQVTGHDIKKRKQYKYHPLWNALRNHTKFYRLVEFGKVLPAIRIQLEKDMALEGLPLEKILATMVSLMERTNIRVDNSFYEKLYGSFGLTTLKNKHVSFSGNHLSFSFKGKKGVAHNIRIQNKKISDILKKCRDIPGKDLFQYYKEDGTHHTIDSGMVNAGMVNDYIRKISGADFTAKDFRTWAGTVHAFIAFKDLGFYETDAEAKKKIVEALDIVSGHLGNTRTVCKKYYVHPVVLELYENGTLEKYVSQSDNVSISDNKEGLTAEEVIIMKILEASK
jgi:DNA topoisomerase I